MKPQLLSGLLLTCLCSVFGCTVVVQEPPPRRVVVVQRPPPPPPPPPPPATEVVITQDDEVNYVVYREYFGCSDVEIYAYPHYRRYYAVSDDDIYFITYVARQRGIAFDVCFRSYYYDCGRNYDRLIVTYNVPRTTFFCSVNVGVASYPPVYQRTYVAYQQNNVTNITIQNSEYVALVHMKVGVEYQGHPPATYFAQVNANGGNTGKVIVSNREACGRGGVTATGAKVTVTAQRPWTMPPAQKQAWHDEQKAQVVKHEDSFKEGHREQVQKVQAQSAKKPQESKAQASGDKHPEEKQTKTGRPQDNPRAEESKPKGSSSQKPHSEEGAKNTSPGRSGEEHAKPPQNEAKKPPPAKEPQPKKGGKEEEEKGRKGEK